MAHGADRLREMFGATVRQIIAVHRCDNHVVQPQFLNRIRNPPRFERIQVIGPPRGDITKRATAGTNFTHDHHGCMPL